MKGLLTLLCLTVGFVAHADVKTYKACLQYKIGDEWSKPHYKAVTQGTAEQISALTDCHEMFGCPDDIFSDYILIEPWADGTYTLLKVGNAFQFAPAYGRYSDLMEGDDDKQWRIAKHDGSPTSCPKK